MISPYLRAFPWQHRTQNLKHVSNNYGVLSLQSYRNFEIQIGPADRWDHTDMRLTIPDSHEN